MKYYPRIGERRRWFFKNFRPCVCCGKRADRLLTVEMSADGPVAEGIACCEACYAARDTAGAKIYRTAEERV